MSLPFNSRERIAIIVSMSSAPEAPFQPPAQPPKVYRAMLQNPADGLPTVGTTNSSQLGARPGIDITVDAAGIVVLDGSGMSVAPGWRALDFTRIPRRLRHIVPSARGSPKAACFTMGVGQFQRGLVANGMELIPDSGQVPVAHGVVAPIHAVPLSQYQTDLESTRPDWQIDED